MAAIYSKIASKNINDDDKKILLKIASQEMEHYEIWKSFTKISLKPKKRYLFLFSMVNFILGYTFTLKLLERLEISLEKIEETFPLLDTEIKGLSSVLKETREHEKDLLNLLNEKRLTHISSVVLGLNDALVELSGGLAGFTFAYLDNKLVALTGLITGFSASLAMASAEFLSHRSENSSTAHALQASLYTGITYLFTVILLIAPYLLLPRDKNLEAFLIMIGSVIFIVFTFNYYICIVKNLNFWPRFLEMVLITVGVAFLSFLIGVALKDFFNIQINL